MSPSQCRGTVPPCSRPCVRLPPGMPLFDHAPVSSDLAAVVGEALKAISPVSPSADHPSRPLSAWCFSGLDPGSSGSTQPIATNGITRTSETHFGMDCIMGIRNLVDHDPE